MRALIGSLVLMMMAIGLLLIAKNDRLMQRRIWLVPNLEVQIMAFKTSAAVLLTLSSLLMIVFLLWLIGIIS